MSALAAAATLTCSANAVGPAAAATHPAAGRTYRVLSIRGAVGPGSELQYITAHNLYRLAYDYDGSKLYVTSWEKDIRQGHRRLVDRVLVYPGNKTWFEYRKTFGPLPPHPFGIRSTARQVEDAIRDGRARPGGLTREYGRQVRQLTIATDNDHVKSDLLWVDPVTDRPLAERKTFLLGEHVNDSSRSRTVISHWKNLSRHALQQLESEPKIPAGYKVEH